MYVCICNSLTEKIVRETAARPAVRSAEDLFAALDIEPICGHCMDFAEDIIDEVSRETEYQAPPPLRVVNGG